MTGPDVARMKGDLARLIAIRTENPPGHDAEAAAFVRERLASEGLDAELREYAPGRVNVVARLSNGPGRSSPSTRIWTSCRRATAGRAIPSS